MKPHRRVFVVGGGHTTFLGRGREEFIHRKHVDYGKVVNPGLEAHMSGAVEACVEATGVDLSMVDRAVVSNFLAEAFCSQGHLGSMLARVEPALEGIPIERIEAACASGAASIARCVDGMQAGDDVALVVGVEIETNVPGTQGVEYMAYAAHYGDERKLDFALFPWMFARRAKAYKEAFGCTHEDIARVPLKAYANANKNPKALKHTVTLSEEDARSLGRHNREFLEDEELREHIRLLDCTALTDGASAVVLATAAGLRKLGVRIEDCTEILGYGHSTRALGRGSDFTGMPNMRAAAEKAYADSGVSAGQIGLAEVHDCFAVAELQVMEALGLADTGAGWKMLADGDTQISGRVPVNSGGGLIGFGHPIGATGVKQVVEIWRQMTGRCGAYQVKHGPRYAVSANLGGDDRTGVVMVHGRT